MSPQPDGEHDAALGERHAWSLREQRLSDTFLVVTDTLVGDFDAVEMLITLSERCVELLGAAAVGVLLDDGIGHLPVAAASSERVDVLEVLALAGDDGPGRECLRTRTPIADDLDVTCAARWPRFTRAARAAGFGTTLALPMRQREDVVGVLVLLRRETRRLDDRDARLGRALADAATIGLLHERAARRVEDTVEQLQAALDSRVVVEQAKGVLATQARITPEEAFHALRAYARRHGRQLSAVAQEVVDRVVGWETVR